jgi:hypothetical protein
MIGIEYTASEKIGRRGAASDRTEPACLAPGAWLE